MGRYPRFVRTPTAKKIVKSPVIPVGESEEVTLEQGTYTFFVVEYSPRGKIIVE